ncbi:retrovirus-related Pol polyprotein from transposon 297 [Trichonephila clavata]|uniref:Retrovirus-related Pol polyprotein from transposon 297 n=1 Tax=Trichonephila clavata TaxID=2740835 RepID=A0A8X6HM75_TRICU|nr:retrovirus-related Pol polyprotein from transposon 297 [Trichonephila clavata]
MWQLCICRLYQDTSSQRTISHPSANQNYGFVESALKAAKITVDATKFHCVVAALGSSVLNCIVDILKSPPATDSYGALIERNVDYFAESEPARLKTLFQDMTLGDKRPSQLLQEMRTLAGNKVTEEGLKVLWLQRLPVAMQQIFSVNSEDLTGLTKVADKIFEVPGFSVNEVSHDEKSIFVKEFETNFKSRNFKKTI